MPKLTVTQDDENPVAVEVLAQAVTRIAEGIKRMNATPLNRRAVDVLVSAHTGVARSTVRRVLDGLDDLEATYLKKKAKH